MRRINLSETNLKTADLFGVNLSESNLREVNLSESDLRVAHLNRANLRRANLGGADLSGVNLFRADLSQTNLKDAIFYRAKLIETDLYGADLRHAHLNDAFLNEANFKKTDLSSADLSRSILNGANFNNSKLTNANLQSSVLTKASFVETNIVGANLSHSIVYGVSAWNLKINNDTKQQNLIITSTNEPVITVDSLEIAQFIYLLLNNEKIRDAINTIGNKCVLIIGRFTEDRLKVLHAVRDELRSRYDLMPIMFEFDPLSTEPTIKTLSTLAHLSRFVVADLTDAKSVLQELTTILKDLPTLPVKPIIHESDDLPPMGDSFLIMKSMLKPYIYSTQEKLLNDLKVEVIDPAEACISKFEDQLANIRQQWFPWQSE